MIWTIHSANNQHVYNMSTTCQYEIARILKSQPLLLLHRYHGDIVVLDKVLSVEVVNGEVSSPITMSGTIVVNGIEASCYDAATHNYMHLLLTPFRMLHRLSPGFMEAISGLDVVISYVVQ